MDYLAERYPDLAESDLKDLFTLGMRFCRPAIPHGRPGSGEAADESDEAEVPVQESTKETVAAGSVAEDATAA